MKRWICLAVMAMMLMSGCASSGTASEEGSTATEGAAAQTDGTQEETADAVDEQTQKYIDHLLMETEAMPQLDAPREGDQVATITTNYGDIQIKLCPDQAPKAVENFVTLAEEGYYDGLTFHRVINNFMIQGGDPNGDGTGGESCWGGEFEDEFDPELYHFRGALSMANSGADTNGSQFFIVQNPALQEGYFDFVDQVREQYGDDNLLYNNQTGKLLRTNYTEAVREKYEALGGNPDLDYGYTVFGQVYEGMDVVDSIAAVQTDENDKPVEDVIIESITIQTL